MREKVLTFVLVFLLSISFYSPWVLAASSATPSAQPVASRVLKVEYNLPYPGILPDSPFYILKVWRDQVVVVLVRDPVERSYYLLLLSDKRLLAGKMLIDKGKVKLGMETIAKGEDYFSQAVDGAIAVNSSGQRVSDLLAKLMTSAAKHDEVIAGILGVVPHKGALTLERAYWQNQSSRNRVNDFVLSKMLRQ